MGCWAVRAPFVQMSKAVLEGQDVTPICITFLIQSQESMKKVQTLDRLSLSFHALPFTENSNKRISCGPFCLMYFRPPRAAFIAMLVHTPPTNRPLKLVSSVIPASLDPYVPLDVQTRPRGLSFARFSWWFSFLRPHLSLFLTSLWGLCFTALFCSGQCLNLAETQRSTAALQHSTSNLKAITWHKKKDKVKCSKRLRCVWH